MTEHVLIILILAISLSFILKKALDFSKGKGCSCGESCGQKTCCCAQQKKELQTKALPPCCKKNL
ncbi:MAG: hypothetical protein PUB69_00230 [Desulfovibrionaceae bacterium]|nr:hypothetical protein [Desulfovibrionaceae bacterium]